MLKRMLEEKKSQPRKEQSDFFDYVLEELQSKDTILTEGIALDLMFVLLFVSFETTSWAITLALKFLHEYPEALKELKEEHEAIIRRRENASYGLTWQEYKSMKFTFQGIELNGATRNFMAFGGGIRYCIGADFAKVQMAFFLHCFVTKYK
ncbi:hypothetical protein H5410_039903 [Solanum commersonii]|uniref:Cytochrome P450 n=1 Tax=Solanum commersonii TaxID=4109 RepID=A0A9J5XNI1_SOLCO|nr:hypothetical protein H5410_039903 [Solanum commersonii]